MSDGRRTVFSPNLRSLAVFGFIAKSLARSRQHRLDPDGVRRHSPRHHLRRFRQLGCSKAEPFSVCRFMRPAFRQAVIAVPLALSLFMLAGLRYLFRLPVELRANWVFRIHEPGKRARPAGGSRKLRPVLGRDSRGASNPAR